MKLGLHHAPPTPKEKAQGHTSKARGSFKRRFTHGRDPQPGKHRRLWPFSPQLLRRGRCPDRAFSELRNARCPRQARGGLKAPEPRAGVGVSRAAGSRSPAPLPLQAQRPSIHALKGASHHTLQVKVHFVLNL